jgi:hypothetical protein
MTPRASSCLHAMGEGLGSTASRTTTRGLRTCPQVTVITEFSVICVIHSRLAYLSTGEQHPILKWDLFSPRRLIIQHVLTVYPAQVCPWVACSATASLAQSDRPPISTASRLCLPSSGVPGGGVTPRRRAARKRILRRGVICALVVSDLSLSPLRYESCNSCSFSDSDVCLGE